MPHTPETIFGVPFKMSDESPFPPDATPLSGQRPIRPITGDSILTMDTGEISVDVPLRMAAQAPAMYELLKELEWSGSGESGWNKCPICWMVKPGEAGYPIYEGHEPDCKLAAVLKAVEGEEA